MTGRTPHLYSYCIPYDDGAAPNPYWGVCTLVICKPAIRRTAKEGDWIVGTGSKLARLGNGRTRDLSGHVVYAMKVTRKMSMKAYDAHTRKELKGKIPAWHHSDRRRRLGDSLYDFSTENPTQRKGVHQKPNSETDLSGKNALLSTHFYYFGDKAVKLPKSLRCIAQNNQGHRRKLNDPFVRPFTQWIGLLGLMPGSLVGDPLLDIFEARSTCGWCASGRAEDDDQDREVTC